MHACMGGGAESPSRACRLIVRWQRCVGGQCECLALGGGLALLLEPLEVLLLAQLLE